MVRDFQSSAEPASEVAMRAKTSRREKRVFIELQMERDEYYYILGLKSWVK